MLSAAELKALIAALAPGLIILTIQQSFLTVRSTDLKERLLSYAAISAVYYAVANPLFAALGQLVPRIYRDFGRLPPDAAWVSEGLEYILFPAAIGIAFAIGTYNDWFAKFWRALKVQPVHPSPTAWDYAFHTMKNQEFILVTMNDGSLIGGIYGGDESFSSSINEQRDLLIGELYEEKDGNWTPASNKKSILICGKDIRFVEFFHGVRKNDEENTDQHQPDAGDDEST